MRIIYLSLLCLLCCLAGICAAQGNCAQYHDCPTCVANPECGYCPSTRQCLQGNLTGPVESGYCEGWEFGRCTGCSIFQNCIQCTSVPQCAWCGVAAGGCVNVGGKCTESTQQPARGCPCGDYSSCTQCVKQPSCAWCIEDGSCVQFNPFDPIPECTDAISTCECNLFPSCEECAENQDICGWCFETNTCEAKIDTTPTCPTGLLDECPLPTPSKCGSKFDGGSFVGGMALVVGLVLLGFGGYKGYQYWNQKHYSAL